ncbi:MAG: DUF1611 domain-containing protein [Thermoplasmata archaeon]|nr:DUF1611 domain-containing protein [Thermoplasmata archaeon]
METAIILCEDGFGRVRGKTAAGLVRHSLRFQIQGVIDSKQAGKDAGEVLDGKKVGIPVFASVEESIKALGQKPQWMIIGVATIGGMLPPEFREPVKTAISSGMSILSGLHEWLANDKEFGPLALKHGVKIVDIRKEPPLGEMHYYKGLAEKIDAVRIPILGTDAASGKRTTAVILTKELNARGVKTVFVATGQTGLLQGSKYGVPVDAIRGDYVVGELENAIWNAYENEKPQVIIVEGQGALSHPAYVTGSRAIVSASKPSTVVLQHAPGRKYRSYHADELHIPNGTIDRELELIRVYAHSDIIGITLNHENLTREQVQEKTAEYEKQYGVPVCDMLVDGPGKVADAIIKRFFPEKA